MRARVEAKVDAEDDMLIVFENLVGVVIDLHDDVYYY